MATMEELERRIHELEERLEYYATQEYVRKFVNTYIGISMKPYTIETPIHGYIPLQIGEILPFIQQSTIKGFTWRRLLEAYDRFCLDNNVNPYFVVAALLKLTQFGRQPDYLNIAYSVHDGSIERIAESNTKYFLDKDKVKDITDGMEIAHIANRLRGIKY